MVHAVVVILEVQVAAEDRPRLTSPQARYGQCLADLKEMYVLSISLLRRLARRRTTTGCSKPRDWAAQSMVHSAVVLPARA